MPGIKSITGAIGKGVSAVGAAGAFVSSSDAEKGQMLGGAIAGAFKRKVGYKTGDPKKIGGTEGEECHSHDENLKEIFSRDNTNAKNPVEPEKLAKIFKNRLQDLGSFCTVISADLIRVENLPPLADLDLHGEFSYMQS